METNASILIVDDHEPNLLAFRAVLEALDVDIVTVRSGNEALKQTLLKDFAVVLLDVQMAGMDGFETAAALKQSERSRATPIIFLTANVVDSQRLRGYQHGGVDYLFKPVDTDVLRTKVAVFVELFRIREVMKRQAALLAERERDDARRKLEAVTLEGERQFRILADSIPQLAWIAEPDGAIHWYNQRWFDYTGTTLAQMEDENGWGWRHVHDPEHLGRVEAKFREAIATEQPWEDTFPLRRKDGEFRWHLSRAMPLRSSDGRVVRWFGTNTDVENERRHAAELRDAVQARDIFLSIASHELKTPLTPLALRIAQLKNETAQRVLTDSTHAKGLKTLTLLETQVKKLGQLVDGLLDVSRLAQGHFTLAPTDGDLAMLLREVVAAMEPQAEKVGSELRVSAPEKLPALVDIARMTQVVTNLLSNALKFGAGKPVDLVLTVDENQVRLVVKDHGIGIPNEHCERIFERFERAVSERHYGGMGLGLWLARQIIEAMDGQISVTSALGAGATFTVDFPLITPTAR